MRQKLKGKKDSKQRVRGVNGFVERVRRESSNYRARIHIESVEMYTGQGDLPTALEYLVILTAVKHRMVEMEANIPFRLRFQEALMSCAQEHGRTQAELSLTFSLRQRVSVFLLGVDIRCNLQGYDVSITWIKFKIASILFGAFPKYGGKKGAFFGGVALLICKRFGKTTSLQFQKPGQ